ncbi:hypothetical protein AQUCO_02900058v1 [Aquilegia coerulea]|uniref:Uncharacterized protein n=1 Tax=Aquilegia coerulea TaxID=218851 RepID=A0A2G5D349_AQUCA|nr:hypothetical protein AQUCO_02900058v1 [Aquilegia coerulea]
MCLKIIHCNVISSSCKRSDNRIIGGIESIQDHLLQIRFRYRLTRSGKTIGKSFGMKTILIHSLISFADCLKFSTNLHDTCFGFGSKVFF